MINDTSFWYLVSFTIFVAIFSRPVIRRLASLIANEQQRFAQRLMDAANFEAEQIKNLASTEVKIQGLPKKIQELNDQTDEKIKIYEVKSAQGIEAYKTHSFKLLEQNIKIIKIDCQRHGQETEITTLTSLITSKLRKQVTSDVDSQIRHRLADALKVIN